MTWVSFWVDKAVLGLEMVVTKQYEHTRYHRTVWFQVASLHSMNFPSIIIIIILANLLPHTSYNESLKEMVWTHEHAP